jgi:signal transduction histidine kinase
MTDLHPLLRRQLKRLGASAAAPPASAPLWCEFLARVSRCYAEADQDRYTLERSLSISSREMQRLYEDERAQKDEARNARETAERASRAKSDFLSNMSHEMRTPLNSILGFGRVLDRGAYGPLNEKQHDYLRHILRASEHMLGLVNDLLDLRRLEAGAKSGIDIATLEMLPVLQEGVEMVRPMIEERRHCVEVRVPEDLPLVRADRRALVQILVNLVSNAAKFTPPSGRITVSAAADASLVRVDVEDTGVGIEAANQARLFTYFEQLGGKHSHDMKGSGIGLALTRALVEKLGGTIGVDSALGRGSRFSFTLPVAAP